MQVNREKLAELLGVSLRTVDEYRRQGMPGDPPKRGGDQWRFDTAAVVGWLRERERANAIGEIAQIDEGEARRRKIAAEAAMAELNLAREEGKAVGIADFEAAGAAMIGAARARFLGLGGKVGPVVALNSDPAECKALIDEAIHEALQELSEFEADICTESRGATESESGDAQAIEVVGAAARPDSKRVGGHGAKVKSRKRG